MYAVMALNEFLSLIEQFKNAPGNRVHVSESVVNDPEDVFEEFNVEEVNFIYSGGQVLAPQV